MDDADKEINVVSHVPSLPVVLEAHGVFSEVLRVREAIASVLIFERSLDVHTFADGSKAKLQVLSDSLGKVISLVYPGKLVQWETVEASLGLAKDTSIEIAKDLQKELQAATVSSKYGPVVSEPGDGVSAKELYEAAFSEAKQILSLLEDLLNPRTSLETKICEDLKAASDERGGDPFDGKFQLGNWRFKRSELLIGINEVKDVVDELITSLDIIQSKLITGVRDSSIIGSSGDSFAPDPKRRKAGPSGVAPQWDYSSTATTFSHSASEAGESGSGVHLLGCPELWNKMDVWYGTNRKAQDRGRPYFSTSENKDIMAYGKVVVSSPKQEPPGLSKAMTQDPRFNVTILPLGGICFTGSSSEKDFFEKLGSVCKEGEKEVLLFVHGFNVNFESAITTAGRMAWELTCKDKGLLAVAFDWASCGDPTKYFADCCRADRAANLLAGFLSGLLKAGCVVHILAHSMGNRVLHKALDVFQKNNGGDLRSLFPGSKFVKTIVFAAADLGWKDFEEMVEWLVDGRRLGNSSSPLVLYCSNGDKALVMSALLRFAYVGVVLGIEDNYRAGKFGWPWHDPHPFRQDGLQTVDSSGFSLDWFGHGYFANSKEVRNDIGRLIRTGSRNPSRGQQIPGRHLCDETVECFDKVDWVDWVAAAESENH